MSYQIQLNGEKVVDYQNERAEVSVPPSTTEAAPQEILSFKVAPGRRPMIASFRQAWDPAGDGSVTVALEVNNTLLFDYSDVQRAAPEDPNGLLPVFEPVEQLSRVRVLATNADINNAYNVVGVVLVFFFDIEKGLFIPGGR